jgi:protocatechuate 3,4-dioxygenase beta subunit
MRGDAAWTRRRVIGAVLSVGFALARPNPLALASHMMRTPPQSRGPFYPLQLPLDRDNDLVTVAGRSGVAKGEITHVVGRMLDEHGRPVSKARVEVWQCDANGRYRHPGDRGGAAADPNFQGYGEFVTAGDGAYRFRTIKPVPYPGRAPHIDFAISGPGLEPLVTQLYVAGAPENERDFLLNGIADPSLRQRLIVPFERDPSLPGRELIARFDIVLAASS